MCNVFRLRYYLRRAGEKQPILLLEALTLPSETSGKSYFLHHNSGAVEPVELRKLQPLEKLKSSNELRSLASELLQQGVSGSLATLQRELQGLWRASVKKVAVRNLEQGQLFAEAGACFLTGHSAYVLLPLAGQALAPVILRETTTGQCHAAMLKLVEDFGSDLALYRLSLERSAQEIFLCTEQLMQDGNLLYELKFPQKSRQETAQDSESVSIEDGQTEDVEAENTKMENTETKNQKTEDDKAEAVSKWVFIVSPGVEKSAILQHFLRSKFKAAGILAKKEKKKAKTEKAVAKQSKAQTEPQTALFALLQDLATEFRGWGSRHKDSGAFEADEWVCFGASGAWRLKRELFDKYAKYIHQRACCFGGFPYGKLLRELSAQLPQALVYDFLNYLCGSESVSEQQSQNVAYASCRKVEDYILAEEAMHPEARTKKEGLHNSVEKENSAQELLKEAAKDSETKEYFSPQGRKMLEELNTAGTEGLPKSMLQGEVLNCLQRSGWAVCPEESKRCYARGKEAADLSKKSGEGLNTVLSRYKKSEKSGASDEWTLDKSAAERRSDRNAYQRTSHGTRDFQDRNSENRNSYGRDNRDRNSQGRDYQGRNSENKNSYGQDNRDRNSQGRDNRDRNSQGRDFQGRNSENKNSYGRDNRDRNSQSRDFQGRNSENRNSYGRDNRGRNSQSRDYQDRNSENRNFYGRDNRDGNSQSRDYQGRNSENRNSYGRNSQDRNSYGRDHRDRNSQGRDYQGRNSENRNSYGRDNRDRNSQDRDFQSRNSENRNFYGRDNRDRNSYGGGARDRNSQARDFQGRNSENRSSYGRNSQDRNSYGRDYQGKNSENRNSYSRDNRDRNSQGRDFQGRDSENRSSYGRDNRDRNSQGRDFQGRNSENRNSYGRDNRDRNSQGRNFQGRNSENRNSYGRDNRDRNSQGRDYQGRNSENRNSYGRDNRDRNSQGRDYQGRNSEDRNSYGGGARDRNSQGRDFQGRNFENRNSYGRDNRNRNSQGQGSQGRNSQGRGGGKYRDD